MCVRARACVHACVCVYVFVFLLISDFGWLSSSVSWELDQCWLAVSCRAVAIKHNFSSVVSFWSEV